VTQLSPNANDGGAALRFTQINTAVTQLSPNANDGGAALRFTQINTAVTQLSPNANEVGCGVYNHPNQYRRDSALSQRQ